MDNGQPEANRVPNGNWGRRNGTFAGLPGTEESTTAELSQETLTQSTLGSTEGIPETGVDIRDERRYKIGIAKSVEVRRECLRVREWLDRLQYRRFQLLMEGAGIVDDDWDRAEEIERDLEIIEDQRSFVKQLLFD